MFVHSVLLELSLQLRTPLYVKLALLALFLKQEKKVVVLALLEPMRSTILVFLALKVTSLKEA